MNLFLRRYSKSALDPAALQKWRITQLPSPKSILNDDSSRPVDLSEDDDAVNRVRPGTPPIHRRKPPREPTPEEHAKHRQVMKQEFPDGWNPPRKISREAMDGLRQLHHYDPKTFTTPVLADKFKISPEAVRRILKGKWEPSRDRKIDMLARERRSNTQHVRLSRVKEALEAQKVQDADGEVHGINSKDVFTFG